MRCVLIAILCFEAASAARLVGGGDRTITKVVKLLQGMQVKSKEDGAKDVNLFAKYKCYCDANTAEKTKSIADLDKTSQLLTSQIAGLRAHNGKLSGEAAELESSAGENERTRETAQRLRDEAGKNYVTEEADMKAAIGQMDAAIDMLADIGADQTAKDASLVAKKSNFKGTTGKIVKAKTSLLKLSDTIRDVLKAAGTLMPIKQILQLNNFLQAPSAGNYASQSGEIVGILKNMRDTFKANLASARASERVSKESHTKLTEVKESEHATIKSLHKDKTGIMAENDDNLSTKMSQLNEAQSTKEDDEDFLAKLTGMCKSKTKEFGDRTMMRANEEAAIAEAVTILNSDAAFETFGTVKATESGRTSFLEVGRKQSVRQEVQMELTSAAMKTKSMKLEKIALLLQAGNPFNKVVEELNNMVDIIGEEEAADKEQKGWCDAERSETHDALREKTDNKNALSAQRDEMVNTIDNEETGLRKQLADESAKLAENKRDQADQIEDRGLENAAYQGNIVNLNNAAKTLAKATVVLKKFYASLKTQNPAAAALVAKRSLVKSKVHVHEQAANKVQSKGRQSPPESWDDDLEESSQKGQATDAVSMLGFILEETKKEEAQAHANEEKAQHTFEDSMTDLKAQERECQDTMADLTEQLAEKEKGLQETKVDHERTSKEKKSLESYLLKIKPGCDFITKNIDSRQEHRESETVALKDALVQLKSTPAFKAAAAAEENKALGKCADKCGDKSKVECKACIEDVSVAGYCASHSGEKGC